jgi:hypothetical protein
MPPPPLPPFPASADFSSMKNKTALRKLAAAGIVPNVHGLFSVYTGDRFVSFDCPIAAWHAWKLANPSR